MLKTVACWCKEGIWKELEKKGLAFGGCVKPPGPFLSELVGIVFGGSRWGCACLCVLLHDVSADGGSSGSRRVHVVQCRDHAKWWWRRYDGDVMCQTRHKIIT